MSRKYDFLGSQHDFSTEGKALYTLLQKMRKSVKIAFSVNFVKIDVETLSKLCNSNHHVNLDPPMISIFITKKRALIIMCQLSIIQIVN